MSFALPVIDESTDGHGGFDDWRWQLRHRITSKDEIAARLPLTDEERPGSTRRRGTSGSPSRRTTSR